MHPRKPAVQLPSGENNALKEDDQFISKIKKKKLKTNEIALIKPIERT